jgi:aspartate aminotransferase
MNRPIENRRAQQIKSSPSMAISMAAREMIASGETVIDLSLGEPDFETPAHITEAATRAIQDGQTRYTGPAGTTELRSSIVEKFRRENKLDYQLDQIAIGSGAKQILFNAFLATLEPGDEVVIPAPYWVSYTDIVTLHGGIPITVSCGVADNFKLTSERLEEALTPNTRWLLLNSPSNPSGAIYSADEFRSIADVLERHPHVLVMSDEIYEHIIVDATPFTSFAAACPELRDRTLLINGVSKAYAMTGWRLGYAAGSKAIITALNKMGSQSITCPSSISQAAAAAALNGPQDFVRSSATEYRVRSELVTERLSQVEGLKLRRPSGAFYAFPECAALMGRKTPDGKLIENDSILAQYLLAAGKVACVPGAAFGLEPYLRLSFATSRTNLEIATANIATALAALR